MCFISSQNIFNCNLKSAHKNLRFLNMRHGGIKFSWKLKIKKNWEKNFSQQSCSFLGHKKKFRIFFSRIFFLVIVLWSLQKWTFFENWQIKMSKPFFRHPNGQNYFGQRKKMFLNISLFLAFTIKGDIPPLCRLFGVCPF